MSVLANMVPRKGPGPFHEASGYKKMFVKSDQEPATLDLLRTAMRERAETIQVIPEESPVGEHQSNGKIENTVRIVEGRSESCSWLWKKGTTSRCKRISTYCHV